MGEAQDVDEVRSGASRTRVAPKLGGQMPLALTLRPTSSWPARA